MLVTVHNPPIGTNTTRSNCSTAQPMSTETALGFRQLPLSAREKGRSEWTNLHSKLILESKLLEVSEMEERALESKAAWGAKFHRHTHSKGMHSRIEHDTSCRRNSSSSIKHTLRLSITPPALLPDLQTEAAVKTALKGEEKMGQATERHRIRKEQKDKCSNTLETQTTF